MGYAGVPGTVFSPLKRLVKNVALGVRHFFSPTVNITEKTDALCVLLHMGGGKNTPSGRSRKTLFWRFFEFVTPYIDTLILFTTVHQLSCIIY
jgi:hypothetical protein